MKLIRFFKKVLVVALVGLVGYAIYDPSIVSHPFLNKQAKTAHDYIASKDISLDSSLDQAGKVLGSTISMAKKTPLKVSLENIPEEIVIEDVVEKLYSEVKDIPEQQARKIALSYCQRIIKEATQGAQKE